MPNESCPGQGQNPCPSKHPAQVGVPPESIFKFSAVWGDTTPMVNLDFVCLATLPDAFRNPHGFADETGLLVIQNACALMGWAPLPEDDVGEVVGTFSEHFGSPERVCVPCWAGYHALCAALDHKLVH
jgi:hypothetical protein